MYGIFTHIWLILMKQPKNEVLEDVFPFPGSIFLFWGVMYIIYNVYILPSLKLTNRGKISIDLDAEREDLGFYQCRSGKVIVTGWGVDPNHRKCAEITYQIFSMHET